MATREENLKKLNAELEKLSDEQLEQVAGGKYSQTADDSRFLNILNGSTNRYCGSRISFTSGTEIEEEIQRGWATVGIKFEWHGMDDNEYYLNGKKISQGEARRHAMEVTGKFLDVTDWKW